MTEQQNQKNIKFKINTLDVEGHPGEKIIDVAKRYGIKIPTYACIRDWKE
jgi:predicted molibdopterin-dependent oxidoreductase YjgC